MERLENFKAGFIRENPIFGLYLGCCSALAISTTLNNAIGMGVAVILVTIMSNVIISAIRKITPDEIRIPVYIVVIATLVKIVQMLVQAYATDLYTALGIFLPLIVVNCIILGRAEAFASKNGLLDSALDGLGMGLGYTFGLLAMSAIRQLLATGMLSFANPFNPTQIFFQAEFFPAEYTISLFKDPIGAFITFACLAAALNAYKASKKKKNWGIGVGVVILALVAVIAVRGEFNVNTAEAETPVEPDNGGEPVNGDAATGIISQSSENGETTYIVSAPGFTATTQNGAENTFKIVVDEASGSIKSIEIDTFADTVGIGDAINNVEYFNQFEGLSSSDFDVDTQSGATFTSDSVETAVKTVLESLGK